MTDRSRKTFSNAGGSCLAILLLVVVGCSCPGKIFDVGKRSTPENTAPPPPPRAPTPPARTGEYDITKEKYDRIKNGMKRTEVEQIIGGKGTEYYNGKGGGVSFVSVKWSGDNYSTILVSFRDEKVTSKSQVGLK